jgi:hypothetical protein
MANCPMCGGRVPFGGGKTVTNAGALSAALRQLEARGLKPDYLQEGYAASDWLHRYGHKDPAIANMPRPCVMMQFQRGAAALELARRDLASS